jgi:hypothetical protein
MSNQALSASEQRVRKEQLLFEVKPFNLGDAFMGARADVGASVNIGGVGGSMRAGVGAGLGLSVKANAGCKKGKCSLEFGFGAYLGIGGKFNIKLDLDVGKLTRKAAMMVKNAAKSVKDAAKTVQKFAKNVSHVAKSVGNTAKKIGRLFGRKKKKKSVDRV